MRTISTKEVKTRKEHRCVGCNREFPKGTKMKVHTFDYDGIDTDYWCKTCDVYANRYWNNGEMFLPGELKEGRDWEKVRKEIEE